MPDLNNLLDHIDRLDQQATKGPWTTDSTPDEFGIIWGAVEQIGGGFGERAMVTEIMEEHADAEFIALARTALPQLAAAVKGVLDVLDTYPAPRKEADPTGYTTARLELLEQRIREAIGADNE